LDEMRRQIEHDLADTQRLLEESKFEVQAGEVETFQRPGGGAQGIFLLLLSLAYQRPGAGLSRARLPRAPRRPRGEGGQQLEALAGSARGQATDPAADLDAALASVEAALSESAHGRSTEETVTALQQRMELYRTLVRLVRELDPLPSGRASVGARSAR